MLRDDGGRARVGRGTMLVVGPVQPLEWGALDACGAQISTAADCGAAVRLLPVVKPTLVLLDDALAWRDGEGAQQLLAACAGQVPVSLLVGKDAPAELMEACDQAGLADCLTRPLSAEALEARLALLLGQQASVPCTRRRSPRAVLLLGDEGPRRRALEALLWHSGYVLVDAAAAGTAPCLDAVVCACESPGTVERAVSKVLTARAAAHLGAPRVFKWTTQARGSAPDRIDWGKPADAVVRKLDELLERAPYLLAPEQRAPFLFPVVFREAGGGAPGPWQSGYSWAVSSAGVFVRSLAPLRPGVALEAIVRVTTTREELPLTGMVAWQHGWPTRGGHRHPVGFGLQFLGPPLSARLAELIRLCTSESLVA